MSMTTTPAATPGELQAGASRLAGLLRRVFTAFTESRERDARNRIARYLEGSSDLQLLDLGFSAADIEAIRAGAPIADMIARRARRIG